jgi:hypothetical protein
MGRCGMNASVFVALKRDTRNTCKFLVGKLERKKAFRSLKWIIGCEDVQWINLAQERDQWRGGVIL